MPNEISLELLADEREIFRLLDRWALAMDRNEWERVEACLAEQFTLLAPPVITVADPKPRKEAIANIAARNSKYGGFHCVPSKSVDIDGDTAKATARMIGGHWTNDKSAWEVGFGFYDIILVREQGEWRMSSLSLEIAFTHGPGILSAMADDEKRAD